MISLYKIRFKSKLKDLLHTLQKLLSSAIIREELKNIRRKRKATERWLHEGECRKEIAHAEKFTDQIQQLYVYMLSRDFELYYYNEHYTSKVDTHTHDYYEFYFLWRGTSRLEIEGQRYPLRYGDMVVIPPHRRHRAVVHNHAQAYRRFVFWVSREYASRLDGTFSGIRLHLMGAWKCPGKNVFHSDVITFNANAN